MKKIRDIEGLVKLSASPIDGYIREAAKKHVVACRCGGGIFCGKMCQVVKHEVEMLRLYAWQQHVRLN